MNLTNFAKNSPASIATPQQKLINDHYEYHKSRLSFDNNQAFPLFLDVNMANKITVSDKMKQEHLGRYHGTELIGFPSRDGLHIFDKTHRIFIGCDKSFRIGKLNECQSP